MLCFGVFFRLITFQQNAAFFKKLSGKIIRIAFLIHDPTDAGIDNHFSADGAGLMGTVKRRTVDRQSQLGRLQNGVLFGMNGIADFCASAGGNVQLVPQSPRSLQVKSPAGAPL